MEAVCQRGAVSPVYAPSPGTHMWHEVLLALSGYSGDVFVDATGCVGRKKPPSWLLATLPPLPCVHRALPTP